MSAVIFQLWLSDPSCYEPTDFQVRRTDRHYWFISYGRCDTRWNSCDCSVRLSCSITFHLIPANDSRFGLMSRAVTDTHERSIMTQAVQVEWDPEWTGSAGSDVRRRIWRRRRRKLILKIDTTVVLCTWVENAGDMRKLFPGQNLKQKRVHSSSVHVSVV